MLIKTWQIVKECLTQQHLRTAAGLSCIATDLLGSINKKVLNIALVFLPKLTALFHYFLLFFLSFFSLNYQMVCFSVYMTVHFLLDQPSLNNFSKKSIYKWFLDKSVFSQYTTALSLEFWHISIQHNVLFFMLFCFILTFRYLWVLICV